MPITILSLVGPVGWADVVVAGAEVVGWTPTGVVAGAVVAGAEVVGEVDVVQEVMIRAKTSRATSRTSNLFNSYLLSFFPDI